VKKSKGRDVLAVNQEHSAFLHIQKAIYLSNSFHEPLYLIIYFLKCTEENFVTQQLYTNHSTNEKS
jgi:hypothetical protein